MATRRPALPIGCGAGRGGSLPASPRRPLAARAPQRAGIGRRPGGRGAGAGAVLLLFRAAAPRCSLSGRRHAGERGRGLRAGLGHGGGAGAARFGPVPSPGGCGWRRGPGQGWGRAEGSPSRRGAAPVRQGPGPRPGGGEVPEGCSVPAGREVPKRAGCSQPSL